MAPALSAPDSNSAPAAPRWAPSAGEPPAQFDLEMAELDLALDGAFDETFDGTFDGTFDAMGKRGWTDPEDSDEASDDEIAAAVGRRMRRVSVGTQLSECATADAGQLSSDCATPSSTSARTSARISPAQIGTSFADGEPLAHPAAGVGIRSVGPAGGFPPFGTGPKVHGRTACERLMF